MPEVKSLEQLNLIAAFIVPGLIATFVRAQFLTGRMPGTKDNLLAFFTLSLVWYGLSAPFVTWLEQAAAAPYVRPWWWILSTVIGPACFGALLGLDASCGWSRWLMTKCGLRVVHVMPTAWDWKFGKSESCWVLVTLKDGSRVAGFCGPDSFISSDPKERDLYLGRIYAMNEDNTWVPQGEKSILIPHGEVRYIEFWPDHPA